MVRAKSVLRRTGSEGGREEGEDQTFENFRGSTQERDRAIGKRSISGFARFRDRKDYSLFPHGRKLRLLDRKVAKVGKERYGLPPEVFQMDHG